MCICSVRQTVDTSLLWQRSKRQTTLRSAFAVVSSTAKTTQLGIQLRDARNTASSRQRQSHWPTEGLKSFLLPKLGMADLSIRERQRTSLKKKSQDTLFQFIPTANYLKSKGLQFLISSTHLEPLLVQRYCPIVVFSNVKLVGSGGRFESFATLISISRCLSTVLICSFALRVTS